VSLDILFAAESLLPARGGGERFALELLEELARRGHRVRALWLSGGGDAAAAVQRLPAGVAGRELPAPPRDPANYWAAIDARREALTAAVRAMAAPDVAITQLHGAPAALEARAPFVVLLPSYESLCKVAHGPGAEVLADRVLPLCPPPRDCVSCPLAAPGAGPARRAQEAALASAHALLAGSGAVAAAARAWTRHGRVVVTGCVAGAPQVDGAHGGHVLLAAGAWAPHKGVALLEQIVAGLSGRRVVVTAAGLDARLAARLTVLGAELRDAPLAESLAGAHACVVPSQWPEPFCRVAFEAQACGVPVLAPRTGGLPEHVAAGGLLAPDAVPADYVAAVRSLDDASAWAYASAAARTAAGAVLSAEPLARTADAVEAAAAA
jgi:glycosyltransferase involved in cell wall biosynthesis